MDNPKVTKERSSVPDWASSKPHPGTAQQVAEEAIGGVPKISDRQRSFLLDLIEKKRIKPEHEGKVDLVMKCLRISEDPEEYGMSRDKASELIDWFLKQPDKPREQQIKTTGPLGELQPGRYAIENSKGELRFYQLWSSPDDKVHRLYVMFGPYEAKLPKPAQQAIAQKILDADPKQCALRFGAEIGQCSNCGRRLTNRVSRELSIGPICGGRIFDDEWKQMEREARAAIIARGEDPDEDIDDEVREPHFTGDFVVSNS
jgi:hypothetical protein